MIPRGEVGLIFATLGLNEHVFGQNVYAALLLVVLVTTVATPPALRWRLLAMRSQQRVTPTTAPGRGTDVVHVNADGLVDLEVEPSPATALVVALRSARLCSDHAAAPALLAWLEAFPPGPRRWDDVSRTEFLALLADGGPRSWRLLTASGVLQRCLPELDDALAHRRTGRVRPRPARPASPEPARAAQRAGRAGTAAG